MKKFLIAIGFLALASFLFLWFGKSKSKSDFERHVDFKVYNEGLTPVFIYEKKLVLPGEGIKSYKVQNKKASSTDKDFNRIFRGYADMSLISKEKGDSLNGIFYLTKDVLVYQNGKKLFLEYKDFKTEVELPKGELFFDLIKNDDKIYLFLVKESTNEIMDFVLIQFDEKLEKISTKEFSFKSSNFIDGQVGSVHEGPLVDKNYLYISFVIRHGGILKSQEFKYDLNTDKFETKILPSHMLTFNKTDSGIYSYYLKDGGILEHNSDTKEEKFTKLDIEEFEKENFDCISNSIHYVKDDIIYSLMWDGNDFNYYFSYDIKAKKVLNFWKLPSKYKERILKSFKIYDKDVELKNYYN